MARIPFTVAIDPKAYEAIERLSKLQGSSKSSIINEYLLSTVDTINSVSDMIEMLKSATDDQRQKIMAGLAETQKNAADQLSGLTDSIKAHNND